MNTPTSCAVSPIKNLIDSFDSGSKKERNAAIVKVYLGLDGNGGGSMEAAGSPHGLTRESVRQILAKYKQVLVAHKTSFDGLKRAIALLEKHAPLTATSAEEMLVAEGLLPENFRVEGIIETANYIGLKKNGIEASMVKEKSSWSNSVSRFVVTPKYENLPKTIFSKILKETSHNGASSAVHLASELSVTKATSEKFIRNLIDSIPEAQWLDEGKNWFYFANNGRNRLITRLNKIFTIYSKASFTNVKEGIRRSINKHNDEIFRRPPDHVLKAIFLDQGLNINNEVVERPNDFIQDQNILKFEHLIVNAIKTQPDNRITELKLENSVVGDATEKYAFSMSLNYSPLLVRKRRGIYELTGTL